MVFHNTEKDHIYIYIYICGILKEHDTGGFEWPEPMPCHPLADFLDDRDPHLACTGLPLPTAIIVHENVKKLLLPLIEDGCNAFNNTFVITCGSNRDMSKCWYDRAPTMTERQSRGF